jgi:hypothetical protein
VSEWNPSTDGSGYYRWDLPAQCWSGAEWQEDNIRICRGEDGNWWGFTEVDQCTHRDLGETEIQAIRVELKLDEDIQ